jgi:hypothetical protein
LILHRPLPVRHTPPTSGLRETPDRRALPAPPTPFPSPVNARAIKA